MEVHHHPEVERKTLKEYFFEGIMIFLAVTMGFFAENIRERVTDHNKEREYVSNIKMDLIHDTISLNAWIPALVHRVTQMDSLIVLLEMSENAPYTVPNGGDLYYYARTTTRARVFTANNSTVSELKNSGNLRLINDKQFINGLAAFQWNIDAYMNITVIEHNESELLYPYLGSLFDASIFNRMFKGTYLGRSTSEDSVTSGFMMDNMIIPTGNPQLRNHNNDVINELIFHVHQRKSTILGELRLLDIQKRMAGELLRLIEKDYGL